MISYFYAIQIQNEFPSYSYWNMTFDFMLRKIFTLKKKHEEWRYFFVVTNVYIDIVLCRLWQHVNEYHKKIIKQKRMSSIALRGITLLFHNVTHKRNKKKNLKDFMNIMIWGWEHVDDIIWNRDDSRIHKISETPK